MFISRLEMHGFKSFGSRTAVEFRPGVMAVVGPNGCGKTNIVDAIRWVLGEQRTSILRADRMDAVIFNGTERRKPLGMAEVTLTIDNNKGILPAVYSEVALTRRLYRSGESEYLLNREPGRLRDIHDLFTDTGFGSNAYSIIELAMVEGIISGPASARRFLIEEAAGVSRYKARRLAAEKRLETIREDLLRIDDIYQEVEKSYHSLKRHAGRAKRYQQLEKAIKCRLVADLAEERLDIIRRRAPLEARLAELELEREQAEHNATRATSELLSLEGRELSLNERVNRTQDTLKRLERREAELDGEAALVKQRVTFLESQGEQADARRNELRESVTRMREIAEKSVAETESIKARLEAIKTERGNLEGELARLNERLAAASEQTARARQAESEARAALAAVQDRLSAGEAMRRTLQSRLERVSREEEALSQEIAGLRTRATEANVAGEAAGRAVTEAAAELAGTEQELSRVRARHDAAVKERSKAFGLLESARGTLATHRSRGGFAQLPEAIRRIAEAEKLQTLAARLVCRPEHRIALAAALHSVLDALDRPDLENLLALAAGSQVDRRAVMRHSIRSATASATPLPPNESGCAAGSNLVQNVGEVGDFLRRRLADVVLVPDVESVRRAAEWAREKGIRLVTPQGLLLEPDGVAYITPSADAEAYQIGWEEREKVLAGEFAAGERALAAAESELNGIAQSLSAAESGYQSARAAMRRCEDEGARLARLNDSTQQDLKRIEARITTLAQDRAALAAELESFGGAQEAGSDQGQLQGDLDVATEARKSAEKVLGELEAERTGLAQKSAALSAESAGLTERLAAVERESERSEREGKAAQDALATLEARLAEGAAELERTRQATENIAAQLELLNRERTDVTATLEAARRERAEGRQAREAATAKLNAAQEAQKASYQERSAVEAEAIGLRERLREVDRRLLEDADFPPANVDEKTAMDMVATLAELELADLTADKLKLRMQALGPVNMLALEELVEVEKRYQFLSDQKLDLQKGIEVLTETIDRINSEARRLFRETFDKVNYHFQETFRTLFEGGEARIALEEGDPLEADIKIWATPSGKKLQHLSMLSGGEKALTAVALLFSIYRARPTPFCILDEVDAPLDDANVMRFNKLIHQHATDTQFLIVSHNKRTMEAADCLYGVTLGEDGCSRIVSVKIEMNGSGGATPATADASQN